MRKKEVHGADTGGNPSNGPVPVSVTPNSGSGAVQTFTIKLSHPGGYKQLSDVRLLINAKMTGVQACYIYYTPMSNSFLLVNDAGNSTVASELKSGVSIENSQCAVLTKGASATGEGNDLSVTIPVQFKPAFVGPKKLFLYAVASSGETSGLALEGEYTAAK